MLQRVVQRSRSERAEKSSEKLENLADISEAKRLVRVVADPCPPGEHVGDTIRRVAIALRWKEGRTADVWYGAARVIKSAEMDRLRSLERRHNLRQLDNEFSRHYGQLAALRARMQTFDPEFHRADCAAITFLLDELQKALQR